MPEPPQGEQYAPTKESYDYMESEKIASIINENSKKMKELELNEVEKNFMNQTEQSKRHFTNLYIISYLKF